MCNGMKVDLEMHHTKMFSGYEGWETLACRSSSVNPIQLKQELQENLAIQVSIQTFLLQLRTVVLVADDKEVQWRNESKRGAVGQRIHRCFKSEPIPVSSHGTPLFTAFINSSVPCLMEDKLHNWCSRSHLKSDSNKWHRPIPLLNNRKTELDLLRLHKPNRTLLFHINRQSSLYILWKLWILEKVFLKSSAGFYARSN